MLTKTPVYRQSKRSTMQVIPPPHAARIQPTQSSWSCFSRQRQRKYAPGIQAEVLGQEVKRRKANILLDSGAQVSLIRNTVAKDLRLKGKDADATITKVGGEEEEIHTKLYKVSLLSLENNSVHHITAIGIPSISDNVAIY